MKNKPIYPIILTILDGWGHSESTTGNAIKLAHTPTMDTLWDNYPKTQLSASGQDVGLPDQQMGNSEVGHTTIGAGRVINQDLVRIGRSIKNGDFFKNETLHNICKRASKYKSKLHLIGLCSDGGVHSHISHLIALINLAKEYKTVDICIHCITDGRDTDPDNAKLFIKQILDHLKDIPNANICTISGRYYSMDRDCRWLRTERAYKILTENNIFSERDPLVIIDNYYKEGISDEFIIPTRILEGEISNNDGIILFNFRPDRIRQLVQALAKDEFKGFPTKVLENLSIVTFTQYDSSLPLKIVYPQEAKQNFLAEIISNNGFKQLRLAETEKYAHVTYFFNGGTEEPFPGEDRELIPSPQAETYDLTPEMSAAKLTESIINALDKNIYQLIVINYANPDMIGHTGNLKATIKAIEIVDRCISLLFEKVSQTNGTLLITSDHGNAEYMLDRNNKPCKSHTTNLVPFILIEGEGNKIFGHGANVSLRKKGSLADIAPTILEILNIKVPIEMNGQSLIDKSKYNTDNISNSEYQYTYL
uniref:phosphoglycerate mutase n=1 Tax=Ahnfeltia fastigiata TaxID=31363 RepID=UPI001D125A62|nr:phosphoglycerate mutase [Ahnfeltia fastigiata]UAT97534.1 phosphoglycerate mutase [Ahnfeltia fastigiata]